MVIKTITKLILTTILSLNLNTFAAYNAKIVQLKADKTVVAKGDIINLQVNFATGGSQPSLTAQVTVTDNADNTKIWSGSSIQSISGETPFSWSTSDATINGGYYSTQATLGDSTIADPQLTVVDLKRIEITAEGGQHDVSNGNIVTLLKGSRYTFTAIAVPEAYSDWDGFNPRWSGIQSGLDKKIDITFPSLLTSTTLICSYGNITKTAIFEVIDLEFEKLEFICHDIRGGNETWKVGDIGSENPACYTRNTRQTINVQVKPKKNLTYSSTIQLRGDVHFLDEYITGNNYRSTPTVINKTTSTTFSATSSSTGLPENKVKDDYDVDITWEYKVPSGTDAYYDIVDSDNLRYYLTLDNPIGGPYTKELYEWAVDAAEGDMIQ